MPLYLVAQPLPPPFIVYYMTYFLLIWIVFHIGWQSQHNQNHAEIAIFLVHAPFENISNE